MYGNKAIALLLSLAKKNHFLSLSTIKGYLLRDLQFQTLL